MNKQELFELADKVRQAARACSDSLDCDLDCPYGNDEHCYKHFYSDVANVVKELQKYVKES